MPVPYDEGGVFWPTAPGDVAEAPHDYLSTACHHRRHSECRLVCKFCPAGCRCDCHRAVPG
jgi:hypothetical protein